MNTPPLSVLLSRKHAETPQICSLELSALPGQRLPPFSPGAHVDLHLPNGLVRSYSLCNGPFDGPAYQLGVLRDPASRGGSQAVHELLHEGQMLTIDAPKNHFPLDGEAGDSLLLAGGIGITPLLSMAKHLAAAGRRFTLHYCARSQAQAAFLPRLAEPDLAGHVQLHFDDGAPGQRLDIASTLAQPQAGTQLYVCGPRGFMDAVLDQARSAGWPESQLHFEFFSGEVQNRAEDSPFEVEIASSGQVVVVDPGVTVAQALEQAGVRLMTSCEQGVCGTCLTRVLAGTPDHRDSYLSPEEQAANDQFLPCCSRSLSARLLIDL